jgi:hypothetical protein
LRHEARESVCEQWQFAAGVIRAPLATANRPRPPKDRYCSMREVVDYFVGKAGACSDFAVRLGLLEPEEDAELQLDAMSGVHRGHLCPVPKRGAPTRQPSSVRRAA